MLSLPTSARDRLLATAVGLVGVILTFAMNSLVGWYGLCLVLACVGLVGHPKALLAAYAAWITVLPYPCKLFSNQVALLWSDEALAALMLLVMFVHTNRHRRDRELRVVGGVLIALLCLTAASAVVNGSPAKLAVHFCLQYMRFFIVFYFAYLFLNGSDSRWVLRVIVLLFLLQVVLNLGWLAGINPMPNWMTGYDWAIGTGLGANVVGYFAVAAACIGLAVAHCSARLPGRCAGMALMVVALVQLYLSFTIHAYFLGAICLAVQLGTAGMLGFDKRSIGAALIIGVIGCTFAVLYGWEAAEGEVARQMDPVYVHTRWDRMWRGPKGQTYHDVVFLLPRDIPFPLVGAGPGNAGSNVAMANRRPLAERYFNWVMFQMFTWRLNELSEGGSVTTGPHTGILTMLSELGPFGALLFWGLHAYAAVRITRQLRRKEYGATWQQRALAEAFGPTMLMLLTLAWIADYWWIAFVNNGIWIWAGAVWKPAEASSASSAAEGGQSAGREMLPRGGAERPASPDVGGRGWALRNAADDPGGALRLRGSDPSAWRRPLP